MSDESKKSSPEQPKDKIDDLKTRPITDRDAQSVKGGKTKLGEIKGES